MRTPPPLAKPPYAGQTTDELTQSLHEQLHNDPKLSRLEQLLEAGADSLQMPMDTGGTADEVDGDEQQAGVPVENAPPARCALEIAFGLRDPRPFELLLSRAPHTPKFHRVLNHLLLILCCELPNHELDSLVIPRAQLLLEHGAKANRRFHRTRELWLPFEGQKYKISGSLLCHAISSGRTHLVTTLLAHGANPLAAGLGNFGQLRPIEIAEYYGFADIIEVLYQYAPRQRFAPLLQHTALQMAAWNGDLNSVQEQVGALSSDTRAALVNETGYTGRTALQRAALRGQTAVVQYLLSEGADPNQVNLEKNPRVMPGKPADLVTGQSALLLAARGGHRGVVEALVDSGASLTALPETAAVHNPVMYSPLHQAASQGHTAILEFAINTHSVPVALRTPGENSLTLLDIALSYRQLETAMWLIKHGALDSLSDDELYEMLLAAFTHNHEPLARLILNNIRLEYLKIRPAIFDFTVLSEHLPRSNFAPMMQLLIEQGIYPDAKIEDGDRVLHYLVHDERYELVELFLRYGADPTVLNAEGLSPIDLDTGDFFTRPRIQTLLKIRATLIAWLPQLQQDSQALGLLMHRANAPQAIKALMQTSKAFLSHMGADVLSKIIMPLLKRAWQPQAPQVALPAQPDAGKAEANDTKSEEPLSFHTVSYLHCLTALKCHDPRQAAPITDDSPPSTPVQKTRVNRICSEQLARLWRRYTQQRTETDPCAPAEPSEEQLSQSVASP